MCITNELVIMNTWFQHYQRLLYTWKSHVDGFAILFNKSMGTPKQIVEVTISQS